MIVQEGKKRVGRLSRSRKLAVYLLSAALLLSGALWLVFFYFVRVVDTFGFENPHPWQHSILIIHAAVGLPAVWVFGFLWQIHVKPGWTARLKRWSGGLLWSLVLWMGLSGYALYYVGDAALRGALSLSHWVAAIPALLIFLWHVWQPLARIRDREPR